jgi:hypothetical protein
MGAVQCAFGIDATRTILRPSSSAHRHHQPAVAGWSFYPWRRRQLAGRKTKAREQQATARTSAVSLPGRRGPDDSAVA